MKKELQSTRPREKRSRAEKPEKGKAWAPEIKAAALYAMKKGKTTLEVSEEMGISRPTLSKWLRQEARAKTIEIKRPEPEMPVQEESQAQWQRPPKVPDEKAGKLERFIYLIEYVNWKRKQQGLPMIGYKEMQLWPDRYRAWFPMDWYKYI